MDPQRLKATYQKLQLLDERLTYRVRPKAGGGYSRPGVEQVEEQVRHLAQYTVELKEVVHELIVAIASKPSKPSGSSGSAGSSEP